jgi:hypothetical protein
VREIFAWLRVRIEKAPDVQAQITAAVAEIFEQYRDLHNIQSEEIKALRDEVHELNEHIADLMEALERAGVTPPARRRRTRYGAQALLPK